MARLALHERLLTILRNAPAGLTLEALHVHVLADGGRPASVKEIENALVGALHLFRQVDGRWRDAKSVRADDVEAQRAERQKRRQTEIRPVPTHAWVVLDLETTGLSITADQPIEIAAVRFENGVEVDRLVTFVRAEAPLPPEVRRLTGITDDDVRDAPPLPVALRALQALAQDAPLVGHNLQRFDWPMLAHLCQHHDVNWQPPALIDTLEVAVLFYPRLPSHRLTELAAHLGIAPEGTAHRALADALMCARVFEALRGVARADGVLSTLLSRLLPAGTWAPAPFFAPAAAPMALEAALDSMKPVLLPPRPEPTGEDFNLAAIAAGLAARGEVRPAQAQMVEHVGLAMLGAGRVMIEAPTGTGKTRAYLAPALVHARASGHRVIVAPNSRLLQSQVMEELQDLAPQARVCRFLGTQNLVCRMHMRRAAFQASADPAGIPLARRLALLQVLSSLRGTTEGTLRDLATRYLDEGDPDGEGKLLRAEIALGPGCTEAESPEDLDPACWGRAMLRNVMRAEIVVTNQVMLLHALDHLGELGDLVFDEAHNLEDAATLAWSGEFGENTLTQMAGMIISPDERRGLLRDVKATHPDLAEQLEHWYGELLVCRAQIGDELDRYLRVKLPRRAQVDGDTSEMRCVEIRVESLRTNEWRACEMALTPLVELLGSVAAGIEGVETAPPERAVAADLQALAEMSVSLREFLQDFLALKKRLDNVYTVMTGSAAGKWLLRREPIRVSELLNHLVYQEARSVVWTSATLAVAQDFAFVAGRIGANLAQPRYVSLPPVFDYAANALLVLTNHLPTPRGVALAHEFPTAVAQELARFITVFDGRMLGLFTSRARAKRVAEATQDLVETHGYRVLRQSGDLENQLREFRQVETTSLFGVRSLWEGVSVEGPSLSYVAMSKLPFPLLSAVMQARAELVLREQGKSPFFDYSVPLAALQFKQGFGRLNRTHSDRGAVLVLDRRLRYAISYRDAFLRSLPGPPRMHFADGIDFYQAVADFMQRPFDPESLGPLQGTVEEQVLAAHTLPTPVLTPEAYAERRPAILQALEVLFGYTAFRPLQEDIVQAQLTGQDVLAILPTGAGKSLTFQLPALLRDGLTLVVSPLIALMKDQIDSLRERVGARLANCLMGGQSVSEQREILWDVETGKMRLLYVGPERLLDPRVLEALRRARLVQLVVDEAHCVAQWGNSFRPDFLDIRARLADFLRVPVAAVTATAPPIIRDEVVARLGMHSPRVVVGAALRPNLFLSVLPCGTEEERRRVLAALVRSMAVRRGMSGIIYTAFASTARALERFLREQNVRAMAYVGTMEPMLKHGIQEQFMNGDLDVIVATAAFGMGVDKPDVRFVIHFDPPDSPEMYYQEAGRAGRDGDPAWGILLDSRKGTNDRMFLVEQAQVDHGTLQRVEAQVLRFPEYQGCYYVVPEELQVGNGRDAKGLLHKLTTQGQWLRGGGFTARAHFKLWLTRGELADFIRSNEPDAPVAEAMVAFLTGSGSRDYGEQELRLVEAAIRAGLDPARFEAALLRHAGPSTYDYRTLYTGQWLRRTGNPAAVVHDDEALVAALQRFGRMQQYALATCRWAHLRKALGDEAPARCGQCDRCDPAADRPWDLADVVLLPQLTDILDVEAVVVEALRDLEGGIGRQGLVKGLTGVVFGKYPAPKNIVSSPHHKRLEGVPFDAVDDVVGRMMAQGLLHIVNKGSLKLLTMTPAGVAQFGTNRERVPDDESEMDTDHDFGDPEA